MAARFGSVTTYAPLHGVGFTVSTPTLAIEYPARAIAETTIARGWVSAVSESGQGQVSEDRDAFLEALNDLDRALGQMDVMVGRMKQRIAEIRHARGEGRPLHEIVPNEETPLLVQLLTESTNLLHSYGTRLRRTEARALHR